MKHSAIVHDGSHAAIKLPREHVRSVCDRLGRPGPSFSHEKNGLAGMQLHIYCTDDDGIVTTAVHGTIKRVSRKSPRRWAFIGRRIEDLTAFDPKKLVRI